jgi:hypothetical protein
MKVARRDQQYKILNLVFYSLGSPHAKAGEWKNWHGSLVRMAVALLPCFLAVQGVTVQLSPQRLNHAKKKVLLNHASNTTCGCIYISNNYYAYFSLANQ